MKTSNVILRLICSAMFLLAEAASAATAGHIQFVNGDVKLTSPSGASHTLQKGDAINEGDTVNSAKTASAQIRMVDGGFIAVRQDTQLKIDSFKFATNEGETRNSFFSLLKGSFRAVTGLIGRANRQEYRITTPTATIGIRGTDHETAFIPNALPGVPSGAYSKVNVGETTLTTNVATIIVHPNQMGFAGGLNAAPEIRPINTHIFTVTPAPMPVAANGGGNTQGGGNAQSGGQEQQQTEQNRGDQATTQNGGQDAGGTGYVKPIRDTAVVDNASQGTGIQATVPIAPSAPVTTVSAPPQTTIPVTATNNTLSVDTTNQTVSAGGTSVPVQNGAFGIQAQTAADAAVAAANAAAAAASSAAADNTTLSGLAVNTVPAATAISTASPAVSTATALAPVPTTSAATAISTASPSVTAAASAVTAAAALAAASTTSVSATVGTATAGISTANTAVSAALALVPVSTASASSALGTATPAVTSASTAVTSASALTPANALTATTNATAAQAAAVAAATQAATAQAALTANAAFADVMAAPANTATQAANTVLQAANSTVQAAATTVSAQNAALTAAQSAAAASFSTANANLTTANNNLNAATTQNDALTAAQVAAQNALTTATSNLATANSNLTAATTQNAELTAAQVAAQNALTTATSNLATANSNLAAATTQNAELTTAQAAANAALATANNSLTTAVNLNSTITSAQVFAATQLAAAQEAATAAQAAATAAQAAAAQAATLQAQGDFTGAQAQVVIAQQQLVIAQQQQANAAAAQAAVTAQKSTAQTAYASGSTSVTSAVTAATTAQTQATAAQNALTAANIAVTDASTAATTAANAASTAQTQATAAQAALTMANAAAATAATAATTAASAATTAQTQAAAAQAALTAANTAVTDAGTAATAAASAATTAQTQAAVAQAASINAGDALTDSTANLATVNTNVPIVASNYLVAQYNNPAVNTSLGGNDGFSHWSLAINPAPKEEIIAAGSTQPQTTYVLDGNKNLVEIRHSTIDGNGYNYFNPTPVIADADVKLSGGVAKDTFKFADNSGYMGRWQGGNVIVTDSLSPSTPQTIALGATSAHWGVFLNPSPGYVQSLTGTASYTLVAATHPTDSFGNVGTLNSAYINADFNNQTVATGVNLSFSTSDAENISAKNMAFAASAAGVPISGGGFDVSPIGIGSLVFACTGADCDPAGYLGDIVGQFVGADAIHTALGYAIHAVVTSPTVNQPHADLIHGLALLSTATAPAVLPGAPFAAYAGDKVALEYQALYFKNSNSGLVQPPANVVMPTNNAATGGNQTVTITQAPNIDNGLYGFTDNFTVPNPVSVTILPSGIQFGANTYNAFSRSSTLALGPNQPQWIVGPEGYLDNAGTTALALGPVTLSYHLDGGTAPVSRNNSDITVTGVLNSATLTADLTNLLATANVDITMNSTAYSILGSNMPIFFGNGGSTIQNRFGGSAMVTGGTCSGLDCGGHIEGAFTGQNYAGALLDYNMQDGNSNMFVDGVAALAVNTPLATGGIAAPTGNSFVGITNGSRIEQASSVTYTSGVLTGFSGPSYVTAITGCTTCTGAAATSSGTTGISYGTWDQGTFANNFSGTFGASPPKLFWITGAEATPMYLAQVLTGTANYNFAGGEVGDMMGNAGTITSASLTANFTNQTMAINLQGGVIGTAATGWSASTPDALIGAKCGSSNACFSANSFGPQSQPGYLTVTIDGNSSTTNPSVNGQVSGQLVGNSLNGGILSFNLNGPTGTAVAPTGFENLQGVAAFNSASAIDPLAPYKIVIAMVNDPLVTSGGDPMAGGYQAATVVAFDGSGNLTGFTDNSDGKIATIVLSGGASASAFTGANTAAGTPCSPCTDATTGIQWGRWSPGVNAAVTELGAATQNLTIGGGGTHWIASPTLTGPVTMPVSGTYSYTVAGGTNPTDSTGAVGTLNSALLSADFSNQQVNVGVNATVGATTIDASASNVPIHRKATFDVSTFSGLSVSCTATACPTAQGEIRGGFGGVGAMGAVMAYGFLPNPAVANMITGVVAFHR